jgi:hypothetical protein
MGRALIKLSNKEIGNRTIFNNRFVVEVCEKMHIHYRNLRIVQDWTDYLEMSKGFVDALDRWKKLGGPLPQPGRHIELCRKKVANEAINHGVQVNLNENLYAVNEGKVFAEGADLKDKLYIHLKIRDLRIEMDLREFGEFSDVIAEAKKRLESSDTGSLLQKT